MENYVTTKEDIVSSIIYLYYYCLSYISTLYQNVMTKDKYRLKKKN